LWAHSANAAGLRHSLEDHLRATAQLAQGFAEPFGGGDAAHALGLAHDAGKASCAWQSGLDRAEQQRSRVGIDHKTLGVYLLHGRVRDAQYVLHGHHGGLTNREYVGRKMREEREDGGAARREEASAALSSVIPELFLGTPVELPAGFEDGTARDFLIRIMYSCLVDADVLDTAAHRMGLIAPLVTPPSDMGRLWERFQYRRAQLLAGRAGSPIDDIRAQVHEACVAAADLPSGIFRLPAPTGSGKTMASVAFALRHAMLHDKSRVVVAVPFITITEQNAGVYRRLLDPDGDDGPPVVLEHHSNVVLDEGAGSRWGRLAAENWDAPFVVTTTVQLFESIFGRRPAQMRKVHRLANAVVVLDEIQALPHLLLPPILDALRLLCERFGTTVLLASATQPEWWQLSPLRQIPARDIIADPAPLYRALQRVRYQWWLDPRPTLAEVARRAASEQAALVVVNTVKDARAVFAALTELQAEPGMVFHLSTAMCPQHRRRVLTAVRERLGAHMRVHLVSTQLIEAGVDVDFPVVFRAMAPADSLQQAAGRANREGRLGPQGGLVVVVDPIDGGQPPSYRTQVGIARAHMGPEKADPDDLDALAATYRDLYQALNLEGSDGRAATIQRHRCELDFLAVTDGPTMGVGEARDRSLAFRMIEDDSVSVIAPFGMPAERHQVQQWLHILRHSSVPETTTLRSLQPFMASLRRSTAAHPDIAALCRPVIGDLLEWVGSYDDAGLVLDLAGEEFIA
jgi:CRISPR-associated endonuclease/helicase Cas3